MDQDAGRKSRHGRQRGDHAPGQRNDTGNPAKSSRKESMRFQRAGAKIVTQSEGAYLMSVASEEREDSDSEESEDHFRSRTLEAPMPAARSQGTTHLALRKLSRMRQKKVRQVANVGCEADITRLATPIIGE